MFCDFFVAFYLLLLCFHFVTVIVTSGPPEKFNHLLNPCIFLNLVKLIFGGLDLILYFLKLIIISKWFNSII